MDFVRFKSIPKGAEEGSQYNFLANTHEAQLQLREGESGLQSTWAPALGWAAALGDVGEQFVSSCEVCDQ